MFRPIPGYISRYSASRDGQIKSLFRDKLLRPYVDHHGYHHVNLYKGQSKPKHCMVHRLVYETWVAEIPDGLQVNHKNGDKSCNSVDNLELMTAEENREHALRTGLIKHRGEANFRAKLTEQKVREIRQRRIAGESVQSIAWAFQVSESTIRMVFSARSWRHVGDDDTPSSLREPELKKVAQDARK